MKPSLPNAAKTPAASAAVDAPSLPRVSFTPAPWHTANGIIYHDGAAGSLGLKLGSPWVEEAWSYDDADEETLANAHLIAAAPELYAAAQAFADAGNMSAFSADANKALAKAHDLATAALAKARGETP